MKHLWTTAAAIAVASLLATGAEAATQQKTPAEVSKTLRHGKASKAAASRSGKETTARDSRKGAKPAGSRKKAAADEGAAPSKSRSRSRSARAEVIEGPVTGVVAKGPVKSDGSPIKVGKGDTLDEIARKSGIDRDALISLNHLKSPYRLKAGQTLKVPERRYYTVQSGDTLYAVSRRFKVPVDELAAYNDLSAKTHVGIGQKIYIPDEGVDQARPAKTTKLAKAEPKAPAKSVKAAPAQVASSGATAHARPSPPKPAPAPTSQMALARPPAPVATPPAAVGLDAETGLQPRPAPEAGPQSPLNPETGLASRPAPASTPTAPATPAPSAVAPRPAYVPPTPTPRTAAAPPPASTAVASATRRPPPPLQPRSGFEMAPARPPAAAAQPTPSTPVPYAVLRQSSPTHDRQGRPTTLPPSVARDAPSSQPPVMVASAPVTQADIIAAGRGRFVWPVRGEILSGFGPKTTGQRNDGLNIAARNGEAVKAAAGGKVVYAGDQVPSFGNLVLLQHANGWVTAYAHLQGITVHNNQVVNQGQQIGVAGSSGDVGQTQLHFEMRYAPSPRDKAAPIDPMLVLPSS
jgi:murein DD-endopeptidase MepM/ murein hydrolase activator NlpD